MKLPSVVGVQKNLFFINHQFEETSDAEFHSHSNRFEADYAVALAHYSLQQGYCDNQVNILLIFYPLRRQMFKLKFLYFLILRKIIK